VLFLLEAAKYLLHSTLVTKNTMKMFVSYEYMYTYF